MSGDFTLSMQLSVQAKGDQQVHTTLHRQFLVGCPHSLTALKEALRVVAGDYEEQIFDAIMEQAEGWDD